MGDDDNSDPQLLVHFFQQGKHFLRGFGVKGAGRLVCQQQRRFRGQRPGNTYTLFLPTRQLTGVVVGAFGKPHKFQHLRDTFFPGGFIPPGNLEGELNVLGHGTGVHEVELLKNHADIGTDFLQLQVTFTGNFEAVHGECAAGGGFQTINEAHQG